MCILKALVCVVVEMHYILLGGVSNILSTPHISVRVNYISSIFWESILYIYVMYNIFVFIFCNLPFFLGPLYPISGTNSSVSDDGSSPQITLQQPFVYFGQTYNYIYVCKINFDKIMYIFYVDPKNIFLSN